ncbi:hypothetical protein MYVA_5896 [Mycolicibacterium vaccae 95051]|nr:hypothetical protein MYVA_5896 [Mycolicibacterium vaccae 95051]
MVLERGCGVGSRHGRPFVSRPPVRSGTYLPRVASPCASNQVELFLVPARPPSDRVPRCARAARRRQETLRSDPTHSRGVEGRAPNTLREHRLPDSSGGADAIWLDLVWLCPRAAQLTRRACAPTPPV